MQRTLLICLCLLFMPVGPAMAKSKAKAPAAKETTAKPAASGEQAKELSGMSIVGNDEAPKSLYIVPWKGSEIGVETGMNMMLDENAVPVDRDAFKRQLDYYELTTKK